MTIRKVEIYDACCIDDKARAYRLMDVYAEQEAARKTGDTWIPASCPPSNTDMVLVWTRRLLSHGWNAATELPWATTMAWYEKEAGWLLLQDTCFSSNVAYWRPLPIPTEHQRESALMGDKVMGDDSCPVCGEKPVYDDVTGFVQCDIRDCAMSTACMPSRAWMALPRRKGILEEVHCAITDAYGDTINNAAGEVRKMIEVL